MYTIEKSLTKLNHNQPTFFLDPKEQLELKKKLKKDSYQVYKPYPDSEKNTLRLLPGYYYMKSSPNNP